MSDALTIETRRPVSIDIPVLWGDMDAYGHVNNTIYFKWFESARIAYMEQLGGMPVLGQGATGPILASTSCQFRAPLFHPDTVSISIGTHRLGRKSFGLQIRVDSQTAGLAAEGEAVMVWYDYEAGRTIEIDPAVRDSIMALEGVAVV